MGYRLNLNKTKMYQLMQEYRQDLPKLCKCDFSKFHRIYRMEYTPHEYAENQVCCTVICCAGSVVIRFISRFYDGRPDYEFLVCEVPFDYLLDHGMLKEVS